MKAPILLFVSAALVWTGCARESANPPKTDDPNTAVSLVAAQAEKAPRERRRERRVEHAVAVLQPTGDDGASGVVYFTQKEDVVHISGTISGLSPGQHGFHVHEFGDLTSLDDGKSAGDHYNPTNMKHGKPEDRERHVGDLGNITAGEDGKAKINVEDRVIQLNGPHSIVGRALVVHAEADKFTQPAGDAGDRVGIGVIGIAKPPQRDTARR